MFGFALLLASSVVETALVGFLDRLAAALPNLISGFVFLGVAAVVVGILLRLVRFGLARTLKRESLVYRQFVTTIVAVFLWFGVALSFLSIVGLDGIAASLGTAAGFLALGVAYATSDMIADAVAGIYLLRDPDFAAGDTVVVGSMEGVVRSIELRKTRFEVDGDTVVRANADIEGEWTKRAGDER
ncbi:mechanosensitive ion channel domain-containing protein [Haloplanus sp. GCM10025708]|uniref:mechanosensitive ion channel domain-containing protein n=1 Tax=Haloferacaceae TaxID=1644056 RepID=UPI00362456CA